MATLPGLPDTVRSASNNEPAARGRTLNFSRLAGDGGTEPGSPGQSLTAREAEAIHQTPEQRKVTAYCGTTVEHIGSGSHFSLLNQQAPLSIVDIMS